MRVFILLLVPFSEILAWIGLCPHIVCRCLAIMSALHKSLFCSQFQFIPYLVRGVCSFGFLHQILKFSLPVVLKVYSIDPQNQDHFQTCWKCTFSGPTLDLPDLKLW